MPGRRQCVAFWTRAEIIVSVIPLFLADAILWRNALNVAAEGQGGVVADGSVVGVHINNRLCLYSRVFVFGPVARLSDGGRYCCFYDRRCRCDVCGKSYGEQ